MITYLKPINPINNTALKQIIRILYIYILLNIIYYFSLSNLSIIGSALIILIFLIIKKINLSNKEVFFISILSIYFIINLLRGIYYGNYFSYILYDSFINFSFLILLSFSYLKQEYFFNILNAFTTMTIIGFVVVCFSLLYFGFKPATSSYDRLILENQPVSFNGNGVFDLISLSPFLLLFSSFLKKNQIILLLITACLYFALGLMTATRTPIFICSLSFIFWLIFIKRSILKFIQTAVLLMIIIFVIIKLPTDLPLTVYLNNLSDRLTAKNLNDRDDESKIFYSNITVSEFILGKGIGAANKTWLWENSKRGVTMIHRGDTNLVMKGGIIFLIIVYGTYLIFIIKGLKSKKKVNIAIAGCLILTIAYERGHEILSQKIMVLFILFAISYLIYDKKNSKLYNKLELKD